MEEKGIEDGEAREGRRFLCVFVNFPQNIL